MPDQSITVAVEVENLEQVKELRKELEKIRDLKKELQELDEDDEDDIVIPDDGNDPLDIPTDPNPNPRPFPEPEYPKRPRFWVTMGSDQKTEFDFEDDENIKAETTFQV